MLLAFLKGLYMLTLMLLLRVHALAVCSEILRFSEC